MIGLPYYVLTVKVLPQFAGSWLRPLPKHLTVAECPPASPTPSIPDLPGGPDGSRLLRMLDGHVVSRKGCLGKCTQSKLCL